MLEQLKTYLKPPTFPADEDKTFTAGLLHVILWSLLVGICLYTFIATIFSFIEPDMRLSAWLYVLALGGLAVVLMLVMRRGYVRAAAIAVNVGLWIIMTVAAYFSGGVAAPAYSGYIVVIVCTCLLVSWGGGLVAAAASALAGAIFFLAANNLWLPNFTTSAGSVWSANVVYFFVVTMLLALALRAIKRASQQARDALIEQQKTQQALSHSEQRFRAIFDAVNDAIFVQDLGDGRILEVNQKMCEMYGYTLEEARQLIVGDLSAGHAPYTQQEALAWIQKAGGGEPQVFEWQAKDHAGRVFWTEVNMRRAVIDGQDRLLVVVRNIDDRKSTEAALRREQAYYEAIVNATPVMLWLKDTENRTLHINPAAASLEGVEASQIEGRSAYELYPREQAEAYYRDDLEVMQSGQPKLGIIEQHTSVGSGKIMWVETGKVPVRDELGNIVGVLACAVDITERKEAEQVQAATRQIAEAALMTPNLEEFYQAVHAIVSPLVPANNFYIALYDAANDQFNVPYLVDEFDQAWAPYRPGKGLNAYVMQTGEPLLATPEVFAELEQQGKAEIITRRMVEWLGVPLKTPQGLLGVMAVQNYAGPARLSEKHEDLLVFVSAQVAMAIERKRAEERERRVSQGLRAVIDTTQALIDCADLDTLYRRSVELAREKLGLERCGLYLLDDHEKFILGTFGTDDQGQTTDERLARHPIEDHPEVFSSADRLWVSYERGFTYWREDHDQSLTGKGWNAATPIRSRRRTVGVLYNDTAITRAPLDDAQQDVVAVYGSLLGGLIELKRAEAALAHERDLLQALMDNFPDTIYFKDTASRFTRINQAQVRMLGITAPEEAIGKTDNDFFHDGELAHSFLAEEQHLMTSGEPIIDRLEYNPTPDGRPRWLSASKVPLRDGSGQIVGMVGISRDITDRTLAEQREKTISRGLRAVIEATQELIGAADLDTLYRRTVELAREKIGLERCGLFMLDAAREYLLAMYGTDDQGRTTDERLNKLPVQLHPEVFAPPDKLWSAKDEQHRYWTGTDSHLIGQGWLASTVIRSTAQPIGVLYNDTAISQAPLNEAQQDVVAVYCSLLGSLIELKRTEAELAHERDLLQSLMDSIPDTIYFKDTASHFTRVNRQQARLLGAATPEEVVGKTDLDYQSPHLAQAFLAEEQDLIRTGQPIIDRIEYNPTRDGRPRWLTTTKVPLRNAAGQIYGIAGVSRDVTDRTLAQRRDQTISEGLRAVIEVADELMSCADLDLLSRRAVELARTKLKVERCGLFMLDEQGWLRGTYGTGMQYETTDERAAHFPPVNPAQFETLPAQLWTVSEAEQTYWDAAQQRVVGMGWIGTTFIRTRDRVVGVLYNDTAITHTPADEAQQEVLAVYCSLLGSLIELKHAEGALRESEALYRQAIEAAGAVPYYLDYATEAYRFVGDGIQHLTGLTPADMRPSRWDALLQAVYPLGQAAELSWREAVRETRAGHIAVWRADYYVLTQDGRYCWVNDASVQVLDEQGRPRGAIGILQDITDRKRVELALRESESTMRALLDAIPDAIFRFDAQGVFKDFIPAKNFAPLLPPETFIGKPYQQVLPPEMAQQLTENFQIVLEKGEPRLYEYALPTDGQTRYYESRLVKMAQGDVLGIVRDVTDRKQAELALQQREAYLRAILDNFPYWVWLKDTEGRYLAANRTLAHALGFNQVEELIGKTDWDVTPTVAAGFRADDQAVIDSRHPRFVEEIVIDHGEEKWFETFKSPIFDVQGNVIGTAGFSHDITARRQAEAAIRESEVLFRQLADNAPAFIAMNDEHGMPTYLNRAWQEFRGDVPAMMLEDWAERIHPDDRRRYTHEFRSALQGQRKFTTEYRLRRADGQYRWLLDTAVPRYAADERFAGFISIAVDITDRKNAEEALRRSEGRLRLITDNMVDSISQVDAQQRLVYASPSAERVFGHSLRDLLGRSLYDFVHPEDGARLYHQLVMAIELRAPSLRLEYRYRHAAGHHLWVESEMRLLYDERGDFTGAVYGSRDISARKQVEADRENLIKELEDKNAELERFTYTVSHDLKSPLITIRGFLGFLEKDAAAGNFDRLRADIARIVEATIRMQRLLDELLELSRIGRMSNPPEEVAFGQVVREAVEAVHGRITARGVQVEIADDLPTVYVDHTRLVEALQNLVDNAAKFMGDQPEPRIVIGALGIERAGMPIFFVEDNGLGIEPEYHERIFGLFNKLDAKSEGTGVGLALVKRIIDLHGGYIWVESDGAGHGSTFFFTLPRSAATSRNS